jgi:hypothetical protein
VINPATPRAVGVLPFCIAAKLLILLIAGTQYGFLADELYLLDAATRPALGYVDFPPLTPGLLAVLTWIGGTDLIWLRGLACATGIVTTLLAVDVCRILGGRTFAQWTTATIVLFAPAFLSVQSILTMNVFDQLWWLLAFSLLLRYLHDHQPRYMLLLGLVFGLALLTKLAIAAFIACLLGASALYARWMYYRTESWAGSAVALLMIAPFVLWQADSAWPLLEFVQAYNANQPEPMVLDQPIFGLIATMNPPFMLVWVPGLIYALMAPKPVRVVGTAAVATLAFFLAVGVKFYFATPLFALFTALGAVLWQRWLSSAGARGCLLAMLVISGIAAVPIAAPVLPPATLQQVANFIRDAEQGTSAVGDAPIGRYFPHFAEMHGWPELTDWVARAYERLPDAERPAVDVVAAYFGQAGALNQLDTADRLPAVHSGHMNYYLWWLADGADQRLDDVLFVGFEPPEVEGLFAEITVLDRFSCERCMAREQGAYLIRARRPLVEAAEIRERLKRFHFF